MTNAKAGQSIHNYGLAVDICMMIDGKTASWDTAKDWDNDKVADWYECVKILLNTAGSGVVTGRPSKISHTLKKEILTEKGIIKQAGENSLK